MALLLVALLLESGVLMSLDLAALLGPDAIAKYCLPLTSKVIGGMSVFAHGASSPCFLPRKPLLVGELATVPCYG